MTVFFFPIHRGYSSADDRRFTRVERSAFLLPESDYTVFVKTFEEQRISTTKIPQCNFRRYRLPEFRVKILCDNRLIAVKKKKKCFFCNTIRSHCLRVPHTIRYDEIVGFQQWTEERYYFRKAINYNRACASSNWRIGFLREEFSGR